VKTILITGSEGNIGRYIVASVRRHNPQWKIIRVKHKACAPAFNHSEDRYEGDIRDELLLKTIHGKNAIDCLLHCASTSYSHLGYKGHPFGVLENDCSMMLNLLKHAGNLHKIVFLSSALMYEHAKVSPLLETTVDEIPGPTSSYGMAKEFNERAIKLYQREHGVRYTIWRPFNVVSPLEPTEGEGRHVFVDFFRRLFIERVAEFNVIGSGNQVRCFIWVEEAADCIVKNIFAPESDNQTFNLARDEPISLLGLKDLLLSIGKKLGTLPATYDPPVRKTGIFAGTESEVRIPSVEKLNALLHWKSDVTVRECFSKFVEDKLREREVLGDLESIA